MKRGILAVPNATKKLWMKNSDMCPFDLVVKRLLIILTRPQWWKKWRGQREQLVRIILSRYFALRRRKEMYQWWKNRGHKVKDTYLVNYLGNSII